MATLRLYFVSPSFFGKEGREASREEEPDPIRAGSVTPVPVRDFVTKVVGAVVFSFGAKNRFVRRFHSCVLVFYLFIHFCWYSPSILLNFILNFFLKNRIKNSQIRELFSFCLPFSYVKSNCSDFMVGIFFAFIPSIQSAEKFVFYSPYFVL